MNRFLLYFFALFFLAGAASAQTCPHCERSLAPRLWIPDGDPDLDRLPLKSSQAEIRINGPIAQVTVTQRYGNAGKRPIHARYVFPGSTRAAVHGLTMRIGGRVIQARIKEKAKAAQEFEASKQAGKRAALLEQQRPNVFSMDVANILPGDEIELTLTYSELLTPEQGMYELVYPTVAGPRYGGDPLEEEARIRMPAPLAFALPGAATVKTDIQVILDSPLPIRELVSLQHKVETRWENDKSARMRLAPTENDAGNRDFILRFRLQGDRIASGLLTYPSGGENHFLLMAQPPQRWESDQVMRREYLFVVDVSGSMLGFPLDTTKRLMEELLAGLKPHETFNLLLFSGGSSTLSPTPMQATPANRERAMDMLRNQTGGGGTELLAALTRAFAMPRERDVTRSVVVVTDGYISAERQAYDLIRANLNHTNLFAFGIGSSVNRHLIESMAHAGAGASFVITTPGEAAAASARFRRYAGNPLLRNIAVQGRGVELYDLEPGEIPVMLAERPIVVFGKYRKHGADARIEVTGQSAQGAYRVELPLEQAGAGGALLPTLWARQRLLRLSDMAGGGEEANREEITQLGLAHSLLTRHTSFIAVDETVAATGDKGKDVTQPSPLPQGVSEFALSAQAVPEPESVWLLPMLLGFIALRARAWNRRHAQT